MKPIHAMHIVLPALLLGACASQPPPPPPAPAVPDLAGTHWTVTRIDGRDTLTGSDLTVDFGVDGRVNGDSGCNNYSGPFVQSGATVSVGELLSTRRACEQINRQQQEDRLLAVLHGASRVELESNELKLHARDGTLTFVRTAYVEPVYPRVVDYDCQGVHLKAEYGQNVVRLTWPNGSEALRRHEGTAGEIRYESEHSELRLGHDILWGREGGLPRSCREVSVDR
jgi:heat shock protein HslJ